MKAIIKPVSAFLKKNRYQILTVCCVLLLCFVMTTPAFAAGSGDVAGAMEGAWKEAAKQIKATCEKVIFPILTLLLGVAFFIKLGLAYFDYKKHGQFEWVAPALLFGGLILVIAVPKFIWSLVGI